MIKIEISKRENQGRRSKIKFMKNAEYSRMQNLTSKYIRGIDMKCRMERRKMIIVFRV